MKCRKCDKKASVHMRHHKLALCKDHYIEWILAQTQDVISKHSMFSKGQRILVCVSGGKDSLSLWDILNKLGYHVDGLYIDLGIKDKDYSNKSKEYTEKFAREHSLFLHIIDIKRDYGFSVPEIALKTARGQKKVCSVCGLIKRYTMNKFSIDHNYPVLATGHNLDDEVATLFGNTLNWSVGYLARQSPVLPEAPGFSRKVKPLFKFYEKQMASYAFLNRIDYILNDCPYSKDASSIYYKQLLNQIEEDRPGTKLSFYLQFLKAKQNGLYFHTQESENLRPCSSCGQPTTSSLSCSFCKMMERLRN